MNINLPPSLAERTRWQVHPQDANSGPGEFVLYWLHNAHRGHENPALDVAVRLARQNGLPLLVYQGLCETYPFASDRHHAFILQGARDVQRELLDRGIAYAFHLQRDQVRGPHLRDLVRCAAFLVTEEMPVLPLAGWLERLTIVTETPIACVDTTCVVPTQLLDQALTTPEAFRDATQPLYEERIDQDYVDEPADCLMYEGKLPFEPVDLQNACLSELIRMCRIDHSVAPVADTPGGSRAGYQRWADFKTRCLCHFSDHKDDIASPKGASRLSAYLHYGMISPFRVARESRSLNASVFLYDLLLLREMAFHFCMHHHETLDTFDALPKWASRSLLEHADDQRVNHFGWETMSRGRTGQPLWDACQRSLIKHGELHRTARIAWGKSFLPWVASPRRALQLCTDLNHRFALDGRNPASYGGILWCFGQFDSPAEPPQLVFGAVRPARIESIQKMVNLERFSGHIDRPIANHVPRVAIIGAGIAGLTAARTLHDHGIEIRVFEKSLGYGGRAATRTARPNESGVSKQPASSEIMSFDHGATFFVARDCRFTRHVHAWHELGLVAPWHGTVVQLNSQGIPSEKRCTSTRYVGVPGMNAIGKHLAKDLDVRLQSRVKVVHPIAGHRWRLEDDSGDRLGDFDMVLVNCPPAQASEILSGHTNLIDQLAH
ncbi:MAG: NAD(P)-binding protein, partial [Planctomycetota bacterium]